MIDICICTFRRATLNATLESIAAQRLPEGVGLRVVVADNDADEAARSSIEARARLLALDLCYVHAPARNISIARNACLDAADSDWIAFIDDDEVATPDWIGSLLTARADNQIVFGISQALYAADTPRWIATGDFHSNRIGGNDAAWNGYTANVLIDRRFVVSKGLRFDVALGETGGEDTMFFFEAWRAGARFGYAPQAVVHEDTAPARANFRWLALRRFRSGQIHHMIVRRDGRAARATVMALPKLAISMLRAGLSVPWPTRAAGHALRGMLHLGVLVAAVGVAPYREYRSAPERVLPGAANRSRDPAMSERVP